MFIKFIGFLQVSKSTIAELFVLNHQDTKAQRSHEVYLQYVTKLLCVPSCLGASVVQKTFGK
jgi:hypothetical protein